MSNKKKIMIITLIVICGFYIFWLFEERLVLPNIAEERWRIYERALGLKIANSEDSTCEWLVMGQNNQEVFVWAACRLENQDSCKVQISYATVFLDTTGDIASVQLHESFPEFPTEFPSGILPVSGSDVDGFIGRVCMRDKNPAPPYIVELVQRGTPLP